MTWQHVAAQLAQMGLPFLGRLIGGELLTKIPIVGGLIDAGGTGEAAGRLVAVAIAKALGVPPTPEAVSKAIENQSTTEVTAKLRSIEAEATARWPALVEMAKTDAAVEQAAGELNANTFLRNREIDEASDTLRDNFWMTLYRPVAVWTATVAFLWIMGLVLYGFTAGGNVMENLVRAETLLLTVLGALFSVLFGHWLTVAAQKRKALDSLTPDAAGTTTVTTTKKG